MQTAIVYSRGQQGVEAPLVLVEVHLSAGLPAWRLSGLSENGGRDCRERVRSALLNAQFQFPRRHITVNLAPAGARRESAPFDLPVALGVLAASGQLPAESLEGHEFTGELALTGALRGVSGTLPSALAAAEAGRKLVLPQANAAEGAHAGRGNALPAGHLLQVCAHLQGSRALQPAEPVAPASAPCPLPDLAEVRGQVLAKRALELAAAGGHHLLMIGPPGAGKTMLANRLPALLPPLSEDEAREVAAIRSLDGQPFDPWRWHARPFRAPHHTASAAALAGGGRHPRPGEVTLAHAGVLFLDELPEFARPALETLREPLSSRVISVSRASGRVEYPARFQLVAAMNPCPCGHLGASDGRCRCAPETVRRYLGRLSGPLLDRIDMHLEVQGVPGHTLLQSRRQSAEGAAAESSAAVCERVAAAQARQRERQGGLNAELGVSALDRHCTLERDGAALLRRAAERYSLSARAIHSVLKVARTAADLDAHAAIGTAHLAEALSGRQLERQREPV